MLDADSIPETVPAGTALSEPLESSSFQFWEESTSGSLTAPATCEAIASTRLACVSTDCVGLEKDLLEGVVCAWLEFRVELLGAEDALSGADEVPLESVGPVLLSGSLGPSELPGEVGSLDVI